MERKVASDYPQELLDLFHEYQHGDIDRRVCDSYRRYRGFITLSIDGRSTRRP